MKRKRKGIRNWLNITQYVVIISIILFLCVQFNINGQENEEENMTDPTSDKTIPVYTPEEDGTVDVSGKVTLPKWSTILINTSNILPSNFKVNLTEIERGYMIDERIHGQLNKMLQDARNQGLDPIICSAYRTMEKQTTLYNNQVKKYIAQGYSKEEAQEKTSHWIAIPGTSEHHTGLAVDIVAKSYQLLDEEQENTPEQKWLMTNCYKYGFILRYPTEKTEKTKIGYEPWHYRYVGVELATEITKKGICLEEYIEMNK